MYPILYEDIIELVDNTFISIEKFEQRFGSKEEHQFSYNYFIQHQNTTPGWRSIIDEWKAQGVLD